MHANCELLHQELFVPNIKLSLIMAQQHYVMVPDASCIVSSQLHHVSGLVG